MKLMNIGVGNSWYLYDQLYHFNAHGYIAPDRVSGKYFSYFSMKTYVVGTQ